MKNVKNATLAVLKLITLMLDNQVQEKRSTIKQTVRTLNPILKCELWVTNILGTLCIAVTKTSWIYILGSVKTHNYTKMSSAKSSYHCCARLFFNVNADRVSVSRLEYWQEYWLASELRLSKHSVTVLRYCHKKHQALSHLFKWNGITVKKCLKVSKYRLYNKLNKGDA